MLRAAVPLLVQALQLRLKRKQVDALQRAVAFRHCALCRKDGVGDSPMGRVPGRQGDTFGATDEEDVAAIRKVLAGGRDVPAARHTLLTSLTPSSKAFERAFSGARFLESACVSGMTRRN
mgnify:CR=1 FL=1